MTGSSRVIYHAPDEVVARNERLQRRLRGVATTDPRSTDLDQILAALSESRSASRADAGLPAGRARSNTNDADEDGNTGAFAVAASALRPTAHSVAWRDSVLRQIEVDARYQVGTQQSLGARVGKHLAKTYPILGDLARASFQDLVELEHVEVSCLRHVVAHFEAQGMAHLIVWPQGLRRAVPRRRTNPPSKLAGAAHGCTAMDRSAAVSGVEDSAMGKG